MTIPVEPSKQFVLDAATTASRFVRDHVGDSGKAARKAAEFVRDRIHVSAKATLNDVTFTVRIRRRPWRAPA